MVIKRQVVKFMVGSGKVTQYPSDSDVARFIATITDPDLAKHCQTCQELIRRAKEDQAVEANKNASELLMEVRCSLGGIIC